MQNKTGKQRRNQSNSIQWVLASTLGILFLTWFFSSVDRRTSEEKMIDRLDDAAASRRLEEKISQSRQAIYQDVVRDVKKELDKVNVHYINVEISESRFVWVYLSDIAKDGDYVAKTLCLQLKKHLMNGVTVFDSNGDTIGRSICK